MLTKHRFVSIIGPGKPADKAIVEIAILGQLLRIGQN